MDSRVNDAFSRKDNYGCLKVHVNKCSYSRQISDFMFNMLTKRMNFVSKLYEACPMGPCTNHPAHLGPFKWA